MLSRPLTRGQGLGGGRQGVACTVRPLSGPASPAENSTASRVLGDHDQAAFGTCSNPRTDSLRPTWPSRSSVSARWGCGGDQRRVTGRFPYPLPLPLPRETAGGSRGGAQSGSQVKDVGKVESEVAGASRRDLSPGGLALGALGRGLPPAACGLRADPAGPRGGSLVVRSCAYCTEGLREDHAGAGNKVLRRCRGETSGPSPQSPSPGGWGLAGHVGDCGVTPRTSRRKTEPHVSWGREPRPPGPGGRMARRRNTAPCPRPL